MKLAIIGASPGQYYLCRKAREMGVETLCFAWEKGAVCRDLVDKFYPISITEEDEILRICRQERIDGVVSNASDKTSELVAFIAEEMHLHGTRRSVIRATRDKTFTREISQHIEGLTPIRYYDYEESGYEFCTWFCLQDLKAWTKCICCRVACSGYHSVCIFHLNHHYTII